ncbi:MAG: glycosyltransferase family 39 protein [Solirubrobacteraceae bacterium]
MSATAPERPRPAPVDSLFGVPRIADFRVPARLDRLPRALTTGGVLVALLAVSAFLRTRTIGGELWFQEAGAIGLATQPLGSLLSAVGHAGASPFYYLILHFWIDVFGTSESATHVLSLIVGLATVPLGMWLGWLVGGRRAGVFTAVMFAFSSFLTRYAEETQPYELMVALGLLATAGLVLGFVHRRRAYLWLFGVTLALMLYTQGDAILYWFGAAVAIVIIARTAPTPEGGRRGIGLDAALCFGAAAIVYLPWLPTTIGQMAHSTAVWHYTPLLGATIPRQLLGSERVDVTLLVAFVIALAPLAARSLRRTREARIFWALISVVAGAIVAARIAGFFLPIWAWRYFAPVVAPLLLLSGLSLARARVVGFAAVLFCIAFLANAGSFAPSYKSDMSDVAAQLGPLLHPGDVVVVAQPEQTPLASYYLPAGLRWYSTIGAVSQQSYMNWDGALGRLGRSSPAATLDPLVASLRPGQQLLFVRPLTEGARNWDEPWTELVRRRSAQWGQLLTADTANGTLTQVALAPANYRSACCVADSAMLYRKGR